MSPMIGMRPMPKSTATFAYICAVTLEGISASWAVLTTDRASMASIASPILDTISRLPYQAYNGSNPIMALHPIRVPQHQHRLISKYHARRLTRFRMRLSRSLIPGGMAFFFFLCFLRPISCAGTVSYHGSSSSLLPKLFPTVSLNMRFVTKLAMTFPISYALPSLLHHR